MIIIYGKPQCPHCESAKQFCNARLLKYEYRELGVDFDRDQILEEFPEARTFPQIVVNGEKIGGFDKLADYIENTGYTGTGHSL